MQTASESVRDAAKTRLFVLAGSNSGWGWCCWALPVNWLLNKKVLVFRESYELCWVMYIERHLQSPTHRCERQETASSTARAAATPEAPGLVTFCKNVLAESWRAIFFGKNDKSCHRALLVQGAVSCGVSRSNNIIAEVATKAGIVVHITCIDRD